QVGLHKFGAACRPISVRNGLICLKKADRQKAEKYLKQHTDVDRPEREREQLRIPLAFGLHRPHAEQQQSQAERTVNAVKRSVCVNGRGVQALHIIKSDRRIYHKSENAGSDQIPKCDRDKEIDDPFILLQPWFPVRMADVFESLVTDENERYDLERRKRRAECQSNGRRSREIEVMECSYDAAAQVDRTGEKRRVCRMRRANDAEFGKKERDDDGRKNLKESFDPEVNDPPSPIFDDRQVRTHSQEKTGRVGQSDARRRQQIKHD